MYTNTFIKSDFLLFSKEEHSKGYPYRLYFVYLPSLLGTPRIHRFFCRKNMFKKAVPGQIYEIIHKKTFIQSMEECGDGVLTGEQYQTLLAIRDEHFKTKLAPSLFNKLHISRLCGNSYYSIEEIREIMNFKPGICYSAFCVILKYVASILCLVLPVLGFFYSIYYLSSVHYNAKYASSFGFALLPLYYFLAMPFLIFAITFLTNLTECLLMKLPSYRWYTVKHELFATGGKQRSGILHQNEKTRYYRFGLISAMLYVCILVFILV